MTSYLKNNSPFNSSLKDFDELKIKIYLKIKKIKAIAEPLPICRGQTLILGSLEYIRIILNRETLDKEHEKDLLNFIEIYIEEIELILNKFDEKNDKFESIDMNLLEKLFEQFQDYVNIELKIIQRVDDENFSYKDYY